MKYYRSKTGEVVHRPDCTRLGGALPWHWAEGRSNAYIAMQMAEKGVRPCKLCNPPLWPTNYHFRLVSNGD